jgi:hypothetical protein
MYRKVARVVLVGLTVELVILTVAVLRLLAEIMAAAVHTLETRALAAQVVLGPFVLSGPAQHAPSHQQTQVICNGIVYSY